MRRKTNLDKRMKMCAHLLVSEPERLSGHWLNTFDFEGTRYNGLHVELGCGKGLFTVETASEMPNVLLVALEKITNVLVIALERTGQSKLQNIKYINRLADDLDDFFSPGEVARIYINFCDPWPTRRHAKRRLTAAPFLDLYRQILCPGGDIFFKTDNLPLFEYSLREFKRSGFSVSDETRNLHEFGPAGIMTDYELKFYEQGLAVCRCVATVLS